MFETGIRQFRLAIAMVGGWHINPRNLEHMVADARKTLEEFGTPGDDVQTLLDGPFAEPKARREYQVQMIRRTARRLKRFSPYYRKLFAVHDLAPENVTLQELLRLPVTCREDVQNNAQDFLCTNVQPYISTRTTGTTSRPTEIWLSRYEIELWPALAALSGLLRNEVNPTDCMQVNISSRATAAVHWTATACRLVGARVTLPGLIPVEESLDNLLADTGETPTLLSTYASYLAQLVTEARRRGLGAQHFHLRRIDVGGEILSSALKQAASETLGPALVNDVYNMTETLPVGGRVCSQGHLHYDLNVGYIEVISLATGKPAVSGELGTLVITPYYPYRECMPVFRYDTGDVVRCLPDAPLTCELAAAPATSGILGKAAHTLSLNEHYVTTRDLVEVYEALPSHPWPARFRAAVRENHIEMIVSPEALRQGVTCEEIERRYQEAGLDVRVAGCAAHEEDLAHLRSVRADLRETTFASRRVS